VAAFDYDVIVVGSGPAGLTAGSHLAQAGHRVLVLERDVYGGALQHVDRIDDFDAFPEGISGADLASQLLDRATADGVTLDQADVSGVEVFSRSRWVACSDGRGFSCGVVIISGGARFRSLGLPAEQRLRGRGIIDCTPCDAGFYSGKPVVVVGSDDYAVRDAAHLTSMGARVTLLSEADRLTTERKLHDVDVRLGAHVESIVGDERVERVTFSAGSLQEVQEVVASGIAVRIGLEPNTDWLADLVELDSEGRVPVDARADTELRFVLAAGDIRSATSLTVQGAVADGRAAAVRASELLGQIG
jgi:thioredoxin reductase (NADPH)